MKKKNGFTLVELLAILIILGIIAIITVPIITKTLKESRINAAQDSAYGYVDAVNRLYYSNSLNKRDDVEDGVYTVSELKELGVSVTGSEPSEGWVELENNEVVSYSIKIGDYVITKYSDSDMVVTKDGSIDETEEARNARIAAEERAALEAEISSKVDSYVKAALAANSSLSSETALLVSEISGVSTDVPDSGWIHFNVSSNTVSVVDYSLTYGSITANYSSLTNGNYVSTFGDARNKPTILVGTVRSDGAKYLTNAIEIYFNPTKGTSGGICASTEEGCMHWYLYNVKGDYANMMLDHNISDVDSSAGAWAIEADYTAGLTPIMDGDNNVTGYQIGEGTGSKATSAGITYPSSVTSFPKYGGSSGQSQNARGPVTALNYLKTATSGWKTGTPKVPNNTGTNEHIIPPSANDNKYQIDYTGYHARLITYTEAGYLGCTTSTVSPCPEWMKKSTYGENRKIYPNIFGYWISSPAAYSSYHAWNMRSDSYTASYLNDYPANSTSFGVRPVITVLISDVLE